MKTLKSLTDELATRVDEGLPVEEAVIYLHGKGLSIVDSIKVIMTTYRLSLGESKSIVTRSVVWTQAAASADALHEELLTRSRRETNDQ